MNVFIIIAVVCIVGLVWLWRRNPGLKGPGTPARTWPASRGKSGAKPKLAQP